MDLLSYDVFISKRSTLYRIPPTYHNIGTALGSWLTGQAGERRRSWTHRNGSTPRTNPPNNNWVQQSQKNDMYPQTGKDSFSCQISPWEIPMPAYGGNFYVDREAALPSLALIVPVFVSGKWSVPILACPQSSLGILICTAVYSQCLPNPRHGAWCCRHLLL